MRPLFFDAPIIVRRQAIDMIKRTYPPAYYLLLGKERKARKRFYRIKHDKCRTEEEVQAAYQRWKQLRVDMKNAIIFEEVPDTEDSEKEQPEPHPEAVVQSYRDTNHYYVKIMGPEYAGIMHRIRKSRARIRKYQNRNQPVVKQQANLEQLERDLSEQIFYMEIREAHLPDHCKVSSFSRQPERMIQPDSQLYWKVVDAVRMKHLSRELYQELHRQVVRTPPSEYFS